MERKQNKLECKLDEITNISQGSILTRIEDKSFGTSFETITMSELSYYNLQSDAAPVAKSVLVRDKNIEKCTFTKYHDIVIGLASGKAMVIKKERENKLVLSNFAVLRIKDENIVDPYYLCWVINENSSFSKKMTSLFQSSSRVFIILLSDLKEITISLPSIDVQRKIGRIYDLSRQITRLKHSKAELNKKIINQEISNLNKGELTL